jgi:hypothetical protein
MEAQELIESYVDDVAARLPRGLRNDVGLELRALLGDQLNGTAREASRQPDERMALELLNRFGNPADVASRYQPRGFDLIEPEDAPLFVKLSVLCIGLQWAFTLPAVFNRTATFGAWWVGWGLGALWWIGALLLYFAGAAWIRRASPVDSDTGKRPWTHWILWLPMSEEWRPKRAAGPQATKIQITLATILTVFFAAPAWFLSLLVADASWAQYDAGFRRWLLVPLIALLAGRIALSAAVAADARRRAPTETLRFGLWVVFVGVLYWAAFAWNIFAAPGVNALFKGWLTFFLLINTVQIAASLRRAFVRVRVPRI